LITGILGASRLRAGSIRVYFSGSNLWPGEEHQDYWQIKTWSLIRLLILL